MKSENFRIGILSDSTQGPQLRENKRLFEEVNSAGHEPVLIDYSNTIAHIGPDGRFLYDQNYESIEVNATIVRIGKFALRGVTALRILQSQGTYSTASPEAVLLAKDKLQSQIEFDRYGIPTPYCAAPTGHTPENARKLVRLIEKDPKRPTIIKNRNGSKGREVKLVESLRSAISVVDSEPSNSYMIQEFIEAPDEENLHSDFRLIIVDGKLLAGMRRQSSDKDEFRSNLAKNGIGTAYAPTQREIELAIRATNILGLEVAGVDIMPSPRGPLITEVNVSPEFGIENITGINVAKAIVDLVIKNTLLNVK